MAKRTLKDHPLANPKTMKKVEAVVKGEKEYLVLFGIDIISKRSLVSRKNGEITIITTATLEDVRRKDNANVIKAMIVQDIQPKIKQTIFNVEILEIDHKKCTTQRKRTAGSAQTKRQKKN